MPGASAWIEIVTEPVVPVSVALFAAMAVEHQQIVTAVAGLQMTAGIAAFLAPLILWGSWQLFQLYRRMTMPGA